MTDEKTLNGLHNGNNNNNRDKLNRRKWLIIDINTNVFFLKSELGDAGPTLKQYWHDVSLLLGIIVNSYYNYIFILLSRLKREKPVDSII